MKDKNKDKQKKLSYIFTRETMGMTVLLFCAVVLLMLLTNNLVFAGIGSAVCTFMYGTFGYGSLFVIFLLAYFGEWLVFEKKMRVSFKRAFCLSLTVFAAFMLFHAVSTASYVMDDYGAYIADCYKNAAFGWGGYTAGGVFSAIFVYPVAKLTTFVGAYVIFSALILIFGYLTYIVFRRKKSAEKLSEINVKTETASIPAEAQSEVAAVSEASSTSSAQNAPVAAASEQAYGHHENEKYSQKSLGRKILFENGEFAAESYRRNMIFNESSYFNHPAAPTASEQDYLRSFSENGAKPTSAPQTSYSESYRQEIYESPAQDAPSNYVYDEKPATEFGGYGNVAGDMYSVENSAPSAPQNVYEYEEENESYGAVEEEPTPAEPEIYDYAEDPVRPEPEQPLREHGAVGFTPSEQGRYFEPESEDDAEEDKPDGGLYGILDAPAVRETHAEQPPRGERSNAGLFDGDDLDEDEDVFGRPVRGENSAEQSARDIPSGLNLGERAPRITETPRGETGRRTEPLKPVEKPQPPAPEVKPEVKEEKTKHVWKKYVRPALDLLDDYPESNNVNTGEIEDNKRIIVESLGRYRISSEVSNVTIGPAITRYDVIIQDKTKVKEALKYRDAIAMELRKDNVTAYLNYTKGALSIEVPNNRRTVVGLKGMLASQHFINSKSHSLTFALGKNVDGEVVCPDITKMPHLLVAGTTGSGKSICLSALIVSLLYKYGPEELRMILVDPKQVEFVSYDKLPHLMINEIIYECNKTIKALNWAINEMDKRYALFKEMTEAGRATKTLDEYNAHLPEGEEKLPKILIVLDEFGDLMLQAKKDIESRIIKLVQKARAAGIHLILATQRPSVDCITGLIKSNLPTRIGFKVNSFDDAKTIFDFGGAEKLLGKGDMYYRSPDGADLTRIQGCFIDTHEVQRVTDYVKAHNETYFDESVSDFINTVEQEEAPASLSADDNESNIETKIDDTFIKALKYCVTSNQASVSMIQRRFPVGYIKACKIIDWMEKMNYVTQSEGSKPRKVLLSKDEFFMTFGDVDD